MMMAITLLPTLVLMAALFYLIPFLSRPGIFFAVTVDAAFRQSAPGERILKQYQTRVRWNAAIAAAIAIAASVVPQPVLGVVSTGWLAAGSVFAFFAARRQVLPDAVPASTERIAELGRRGRLPGGVLGQLAPFLILLAVATYVALQWNAIPERFPRHWDAAGRPNGWSLRSIAGVFAPAFIGFVSCAGMWATSLVILRRTRSGAPADRQVRDLNLRILLASEFLAAIIAAGSLFLPLLTAPPRFVFVIPFIIGIFILGLFVAAVHGMRRVAATPGDLTPDACWKGGLIYYNPADPSIFVAKRVGIGYTLNFGHRFAWIVMGLMLVPALVAIVNTIAAARGARLF